MGGTPSRRNASRVAKPHPGCSAESRRLPLFADRRKRRRPHEDGALCRTRRAWSVTAALLLELATRVRLSLYSAQIATATIPAELERKSTMKRMLWPIVIGVVLGAFLNAPAPTAAQSLKVKPDLKAPTP